MDSSRRVRKWTGAVLAVACAALGAANFLLTQLDEDRTALETVPSTIYSADAPGGSDAASRLPQGRNASAQPGGERDSDSNFGTSRQSKLISAGKNTKVGAAFTSSVRQGPAESAQVISKPPQPKGASEEPNEEEATRQDSRDSRSIDNGQSGFIHSIKSLGIVEQADGRIQAVIQEGEWTRLVEEGEILADNSRVLRITAEVVEVSGPQDQLPIVLARSVDSVRPASPKEVSRPGADSQAIQPETEWAWSKEQVQQPPARRALGRGGSGNDIPGLHQGEAAYRPTATKEAFRFAAPVEAQELAPVPSGRQPEASAQGDGDSSQSRILGTVAHTDGRVENVLADGQWVRLASVPEPQPGDRSPNTSDRMVSGREVQPPAVPGEPPHGTPTSMANAGGYKITDSVVQEKGAPIQHLVEPIGVVEWSGGLTQAVIAQGDSIALLSDWEAVDRARAYLASLPPPEQSPEGAFQSATSPAGRPRDDEEVRLARAYGETLDRSPPEARLAPLQDPEEVVRGQPGAEAVEHRERPPPELDLGRSGPWFEDLPGIDPAPAASVEPTIARLSVPCATRSEPGSAQCRGVSKNRFVTSSLLPKSLEPHSAKHEISKNSDLVSPEGPVQPLGFVRSTDGGLRAVILVAGSVMLVKEGDRLADGSLISHVGPEGVVVVELRPPNEGWAWE